MNHLTVHGSGNLTVPGGHDYRKTMNFQWQNTDTVNLVFTNPKIVQAGSPVVRTNATIFGNPEYLRFRMEILLISESQDWNSSMYHWCGIYSGPGSSLPSETETNKQQNNINKQ